MNWEPEALIKSEWALQRGGRSAHSFSWLLSSPQQPLETEDPPTVSLAPQYTSQHLCRARVIFPRSETFENLRFCEPMRGSRAFRVKILHSSQGKIFSAGAVLATRRQRHRSLTLTNSQRRVPN